MANELQFLGTDEQSGLTVVARVYNSAGAQVGADVACAEIGTDAIYIGDMPTAVAGEYSVRFVDDVDDVYLAHGLMVWDGAAEITARMIDTVVDNIVADTNELQTDWADGGRLDLILDGAGGGAGGDATLANQTTIINAVNALNDFDPVNDVVANVTLVGTTTNNTDMRGTDGANTVAPDNAGIAALSTEIGTAGAGLTALASQASVNGLNDLSSADITAAVPSTAQIEAALINEGDGQQLIDAIVSLINTNLDLPALELAAIGTAVRSELSTELANLDATISSRLATAGYTAPDNAPVITAIGNLNDFDPAADTVANVTTVATTTTNTDMRGTDGANTVAPDNASIGSILADTNELQTNQGDWLTATGFASTLDVTSARDDIQADISGLNNFDPAADIVANVSLVDTTTTNSDMRGTDGANTVAPDNTSISTILADTAELQGDWANGGRLDLLLDSAVAGGGAGLDAAGVRAAIGLAAANLDTQLGNTSTLNSADITAAVPTVAQIEAALLNEGDGQQLIDAIVSLINTNLDLPALELTAIANAVRTELGAELARIDVDLSSRLADADYTAATDVSTDVAAIKTKTDQLVFTKSNEVDVNVQSINERNIAGDGITTQLHTE